MTKERLKKKGIRREN